MHRMFERSAVLPNGNLIGMTTVSNRMTGKLVELTSRVGHVTKLTLRVTALAANQITGQTMIGDPQPAFLKFVGADWQ